MRVTTLLVLATVLGCTFPEATPAREDSPAARGSWSFELIDDSGQALPTFFHRDRSYVLGAAGKRYRVRVRNQSGRRAEVVVSVDGRDVIDGGPSALEKRGYLVEPYGQVVIDGYRLSEDAVAAFRFGTVSRSYAALEGDARDVGVIGVAVFPERRMRAVPLREASPPERSAKAESMQDSGRPASAPPSPSASGATAEARRPGLGTSFGEEHDSHVQHVAFLRASSRPEVTLSLRYDDRAGLLAAGVNVDGNRCDPNDAQLRRNADPFRRDASYAPPPRGWSPNRS
jgi:hypothetical protein